MKEEHEQDHTESVHGREIVRWNPLRTLSDGSQARVDNFGDLLGPLIAQRILWQNNISSGTPDDRRLLTVGSILHFALPNDVVWGSGINGKVPGRKVGSNRLDVRLVRGPRSKSLLQSMGANVPQLYGDPALLIPTLFPEVRAWTEQKTREILVVPNLNDQDLFDDGLPIVSPRNDVWLVVRAIAQSRFVVASSLHALILADALGIPSRAVKPAAEHYTKYMDYYEGTGRTRVQLARNYSEALDLGPTATGTYDIEGIYDSFPLDLWLKNYAVRSPRTAVPPVSELKDIENNIADWESYSGDSSDYVLPALLRRSLGAVAGTSADDGPLSETIRSFIQRMPFESLIPRLNDEEKELLSGLEIKQGALQQVSSS
ncbi:polysaccharide pyruvyl transferase family protein [Paenarthrobacter sp. NPDC089322]|uniref:polysaccharide pyruvyl transferase family protein n=1 Tax=Paenarthrobacter sp. NPDC089322 TaxID=3155065 RepID=UPI00342F4087